MLKKTLNLIFFLKYKYFMKHTTIHVKIFSSTKWKVINVFNHKKILLIMILALLFSLTVVNASDTQNSTDIVSEQLEDTSSYSDVDTSQISDSNTREIAKNNHTNTSEKTGNADDNIIYAANNGNSSLNTTSISNPTSLENAFKLLKENSTIYLEGSSEETVYDIDSYISTVNITDVKNFIITTSTDNNVILRFSSDAYLLNSYHNINISNVVITNKDNPSFPLVYNSGLMNLNNCTFYYNNTDSTSSLFSNMNESTLNNCKFYSTGSTTTYSTIYNEGLLTLNNCSVYNITTTYRYGMIYNKNNLTLNNSRIYNNRGNLYSCAIYSSDANVSIYNSIIENQSAAYGSVIYLEGSVANCINSSFNSNNASFGGVFLIKSNSQINVTDCSFVNNSAQYNGGVINSWYSTAIFKSSRFIDNSANYGGVSYEVNNNYMKYMDSLFENNTSGATGNNIYSVSNNLTVNNCVILDSNNKTSVYCYDVTGNLDENWWGVNNPQFETLTNGIMPNNWRLLKVTSTRNADKYKLNVSLNSLSDSTITDNELIDRKIGFETESGVYTLNSSTINSSIVNVYEGSLDDAYVIMDKERLTLSDKINAYLYVKDISTKINDNTSIIIKCSPDITGKIEIRINNTLLSTLTQVNGIAQYSYVFNSTWERGRYDLTVSLLDDPVYANKTYDSKLDIKDNYNTTVTLIDVMNTQEVEEENIIIPSSYDSRDYGYVTSVKDQLNSGSCWAFGTLATLESALLRSYGEYYNLSVNHMKNTLKRYSIYGDTFGEPDGGNNDLVSAAYLVGWFGPVTEEEDEYNDYSIMSPTLNTSIHVQNIYFIPSRTQATDNDAIKLAIMKYGSVSTDFYAYTSGKNTYYNGTDINHCISIVGWDDNYSRTNFRCYHGGLNPEGDGAWIIKNSWGTGIGVSGYQYVSYYDTSFGGLWQNPDYIHALYNMAFPLNESEIYDSIYQHDTISNYWDFLTPSAWVRNVYTAEKNESIAAVGTFIYEDCDYEVYVYVNDKLCYVQNGTILQEGFRTIKLDSYVLVTEGDVFRVDFKLKAHVGDYTIVTLQNTNAYKSFSNANQSFISTDGENWIDLYTDYEKINKTAACLKVYTKQTPAIYSTINQTNSYNITTQIVNLNTGTGKLSYKIDGEYYADSTGNTVYLQVNGDGSYNIQIPLRDVEKYEYNISIIFENNDYIITENVTIVTQTKNVTLQPEKLTYYVDKEQTIPIQVKIENNTYNIILNSGVVILYDTNGTIIRKSTVNNDKAELTMELAAGTYNYTIYYRGSYAYKSQSNNITVNIIKHPVTIRITNITETRVDEITEISGYAVYDEDKALKNTQLNIYINGTQTNVTTDTNGKFNCSYRIENVGTIEIQCTFTENATYEEATTYTQLTSTKHTATISLNNMNTTAIGENLLISGKLYDEKKNSIANATVDIYVNNNRINTVKTNQNGEYNLTYLTTKVGTNNVTVTYKGDTKYTNTTNKKTVTIRKLDTKLTASLNASTVKVEGNIKITGKLTDENNKALTNEKITVNLNNNKTLTLTTSTDGTYSTTLKTDTTGTNNISISYAGNTNYTSNSTKTTFNVEKQTSKLTISVNNSTAYIADTVSITGKLTNENNNPVSNEKITITVNNSNNTVTTDSSGNYKLLIITNLVGTNNVTVNYAGNASYMPSSNNTTFTVKKRTSVITLTSNSTLELEDSITISGKLRSDNTAISGAKIIINLNNRNTTVTTDNNGKYELVTFASIVGSNNVTVSYAGNGTYLASSTATTFTVNKKTSVLTAGSASTVYVGDNVTISGKLLSGSSAVVGANIVIMVNDENTTVTTDSSGNYKMVTVANVVGSNKVTVNYAGNGTYLASSATTTFTVNKKTSVLTAVSNSTVYYGDNVTISGKLSSGTVAITNAKVVISLNSKNTTVTTDSNGNYKLVTVASVVGSNKATISYAGNATYLTSSNTTTFTVNKKSSALTVACNTTVYVGDSVTISGKLSSGSVSIVNAKVVINVKGKNSTVTTDSSGNYKLTVATTSLGSNKVSIKYTGNGTFLSSSTTTIFTVNKRLSALTVACNSTVYVGDSVTISGKLSSGTVAIANAKVVISLNNRNTTVTSDVSGNYKFVIVASVVGSNKVTVSYAGNGTYLASSKATTFKVNKKTSSLTADSTSPVYVGDNVSISGKLFSGSKGIGGAEVVINVNAKNITVTTDSCGNYKLVTSTSISGSNTATVSYSGNGTYLASSTTAKFTVNKKTSLLTVNTTSPVVLGNNVTISGKLLGGSDGIANAKVIITVNSKNTMVTTDAKGNYRLQTVTVAVGSNNVAVNYKGNGTYLASSNATTFIVNKKTSKLTVKTNKTVYIGDSITVSGKLKASGTVISKANLIIKFNNRNYTTRTNSNGNYKLILTATSTGTKTVKVYYAGSGTSYSTAKTVSVKVKKNASAITTTSTKTVYVGDSVIVTGRLTSNTNPIANARVIITTSNKNYTIKTDTDGKYKLKFTSTSNGRNNITVVYAGNTNYTSSKATTSYIANKKTSLLKLGSTKSAYVGDTVSVYGTLVSDGKAIAHATVIITVDGKTSNLTTNKKGKFNANVTTNQSGKRTITASYAGSNIYTKSTNVITFNSNRKDSLITIGSSSSAYVGDSVSVYGKLTAGGINVSHAKITITVDGTSYNVTTTKYGNYKVKVKTDKSGNRTVKVTYAGSNMYLASTNATTFISNMKSSLLTIGSTKSAYVGDAVSVYGKLSVSGIGLAYAKITVTVDGKKYVVTTSKYGNYNLKVTASSVGNKTITASYGGTNIYTTAKARTTFVVKT